MGNDGESITFSTHNVNGFNRSKDFLLSQCSDAPDSIRAIQEHWLRPPYKKQSGVNQLRCLHPNFDGYGTSAMEKTVEKKIITGRPYGGTGFLYNKKYSRSVKPLVNFKHNRVTALEIKTNVGNIIFINAYMPYYNTRALSDSLIAYRETVGYVENIMHSHPGSNFIIASDFNCDLNDSNHAYTKIWSDVIASNNLFSAFEIMDNFDVNSFTRCEPKTRSFSILDGFLISNDLRTNVTNVRISHIGTNVSDHSPVEFELTVPISSIVKNPYSSMPGYINWKKLTEEQTTAFRHKMLQELNAIDVSYLCILHGDMCCTNDAHKLCLENYYCDIVRAVTTAESVLPKTNPISQRSFWTDELTNLKRESVECTNYWRSIGSPRHGPAFECKKKCQLLYKSKIRREKNNDAKKKSDTLHSDLLEKQGISFWKTWNKINQTGNSLSTRVDGETEGPAIANSFATYFESVYSGHDTFEHEQLRDKFTTNLSNYYAGHINDIISPYYISWSEMLDIASKIKIGKSTAGQIRPEHIFCGAPELMYHFHLLFNGLIQHGFVPTAFLEGTISPIVKDSQGNFGDSSNYRAITLSCLPAKLFEYAIQIKTSHLLETDELQFGFKRRTSTSHALHILKSTIDHFNNNSSKVFVAFLDCTKAFDRVSHHGLFIKLMERKVPLCILLCLIFWYMNLISQVRWGSDKSRSFPVPLGIKQGGINSPDLFSIYFNGLTELLRNKNIGCYMYKIFLAIILFADDICLLAPTRSALQKLISSCESYCREYCLSFNPLKSKILVFSKKTLDLTSLKPVTINGKPIDYIESIKYLGVLITSSKGFAFSATNDLRNFYRSSNSILNALHKPSEPVLMHLLYTNCVPTLTFACSVKVFSAKEMQDCTTALNNAIRRIFTFHRWESVRSLREAFDYKSVTDIFSEMSRKFLLSLPTHSNSIIRTFASHTVY